MDNLTKKLILLQLVCSCASVQVLDLDIPARAKEGDSITLLCVYELYGRPLHAVNWWKDNQAFYQFNPQTIPQKNTYETNGITVEVSSSDARNVVLRNVSLFTSGDFRCEVMAKETYERDSKTAQLEVVEVPKLAPIISLYQRHYNVGDVLLANCTSLHTRPPPSLTWYLNGEKVQPRFIKMLHFPSTFEPWSTEIFDEQPSVLHIGNIGDFRLLRMTSLHMSPIISTVRMVLQSYHFVGGGRAILACSATLDTLYNRSSEVQLTLPGVMPIGPSQRISMGCKWQDSQLVIVTCILISFII